jgi:hypothetical protein
MFLSIFAQRHTRLRASEWIYENVKPGAVLAFEHWDDPLPLNLPEHSSSIFTGRDLPVFAPDNEEKWMQMEEVFANADYYILSSNRGWGSIPTAPERYPKMSRFYEDLLSGNNTKYRLVAEFHSYPSLKYLGLPITMPNQWADESFTVYDHPQVMIYQINRLGFQ